MSLVTPAIFLAGLGVLVVGAFALVEGGVKVARVLGIPSVVVGLTVVAFGTSAPEFFVSLVGALGGNTSLVLGNVVGSNVANLGLILALASLLRPVHVERELTRREIPLMGVGTLLFTVLAWNGVISRLDAGLLTVGFAAFMLATLRTKRAYVVPAVPEPIPGQEPVGQRSRVLVTGFSLTLVGIAGLALGGKLITDSAVSLAQTLGVSEAVIGLTMVAVGTSLPELATTVMASVRHEGDLALGNIFGSNIFNLLGVAGPVGLVRPLQADSGRTVIPLLGVDLPGYQVQLITLVAMTILGMGLAMSRGGRCGRWAGVSLLVAYAAAMAIWLA
ncbi:calcium/sodium antiporter [bacterium]|nr:calcium/sodium antiporter [bacterium]